MKPKPCSQPEHWAGPRSSGAGPVSLATSSHDLAQACRPADLPVHRCVCCRLRHAGSAAARRPHRRRARAAGGRWGGPAGNATGIAPSKPAKRFRKESPGPNMTEGLKMVQSSVPNVVRESASPPRPWSASSSWAHPSAAPSRYLQQPSRTLPSARPAGPSRVSSVCARRKPPPPKPRSLRMPTRLTTTSLPRNALAELSFVVDVAVLQGEPGQHQQVLVQLAVARENGDAVTVLDQASPPAGFPGNRCPPEPQMDKRTHDQRIGISRVSPAATDFENQHTCSFGRFAERLDVRDTGVRPTPTINIVGSAAPPARRCCRPERT